MREGEVDGGLRKRKGEEGERSLVIDKARDDIAVRPGSAQNSKQSSGVGDSSRDNGLFHQSRRREHAAAPLGGSISASAGAWQPQRRVQ